MFRNLVYNIVNLGTNMEVAALERQPIIDPFQAGQTETVPVNAKLDYEDLLALSARNADPAGFLTIDMGEPSQAYQDTLATLREESSAHTTVRGRVKAVVGSFTALFVGGVQNFLPSPVLAADGTGKDAAISICKKGENPNDYIYNTGTYTPIPCRRPIDYLCPPGYNRNTLYSIQNPDAPDDELGRQVVDMFAYCGDTPLDPPKPLNPVEAPTPQITSLGKESKLVPVTPERFVDTRDGTGTRGVIAPIPKDGTLDVDIRGHQGAPANATAVIANVTFIGKAAGYVSAYPSGTDRPNASILNITEAGSAVPNMQIIPLGADGIVKVYSQSGGELALDVLGYFVPAPDGSTDGRLEDATPVREYDSRNALGPLAAGETRKFSLADMAGIPAGVGAVELNITATNAKAAGFLTVWSGTGPRPLASAVNYTPGSSDAFANRVILPVAADGTINIYSQQGTDVIIDLLASFTGASAQQSTEGLFRPIEPTRLIDTRPSYAMPAPMQGIMIDLLKAGLNPDDYMAMEGNMTITDQVAPTYGAAYANSYRGTSNVNGSDTRANGFTTSLETYLLVGRTADMLADISGLYTAA
jgi:hypothetical protein